MFDMKELFSLVTQLANAAEKRVAAAEKSAMDAGENAIEAAERAAEAKFAAFQKANPTADLDATVRAALEKIFPAVDTTDLKAAIAKLAGTNTAVALVKDVGSAAKVAGDMLTATTGVDVSGIVSAISAATGVASDVVKAVAQAHADTLASGASIAVAVAAGKEAGIKANASPEQAAALASVIATTAKVATDTGAPVEQVARAAVKHDDNTDDNNVVLPGSDAVGAAWHAASEAGADDSTADKIAHAVDAVAPTTVAL